MRKRKLSLFLIFLLLPQTMVSYVRAENTRPIKKVVPTINSTIKKIPKILPTRIMVSMPPLDKTSSRNVNIDFKKTKDLVGEKGSPSAEIREKLKSITDVRKKELITKVIDKIPELNKKQTTQMANILEKLTTILSRIEKEADGLKDSSKDLTSLKNTITKAKLAITKAQELLKTQAEKNYIPDLSNEAQLKANFGQIVKQFEQDLKIIRDAILEAKKAVETAAKELISVKKTITILPTITTN